MEKPLVSIVTPCYNGEKYLDRFFQSVLSQTYPNIELIFINDGSTDNTEEKALSYNDQLESKNIHFIYQKQNNAGQAAALNRGLKLFTGEYLTWMDSDDVIMPDFIEKRIEYLDQHPDSVYCYGQVNVVNEEEPDLIVATYNKRISDIHTSFFEDLLYVRNVFYPGYTVRTDALDGIIKGREIFSGRGGQNAQLLLPLAWEYGEPDYVEGSVYKYYLRADSHSHSQNTSEKVIRQLEQYKTILIETIKRIPDPKAQGYIEIVRKHYARLLFGNAVDTMDGRVIRKYYKDLKELKIASMRDFALCVKYTCIMPVLIKIRKD